MEQSDHIRIYTLHDYAIARPDGSEFVTTRALTISVGSQALEPEMNDGKTLIRFELWGLSPLLANTPKMRVKVQGWEPSAKEPSKSVVIDDARSVELLFDNTSFQSEAKEMPTWLIETLEFAAKKLREQHALKQDGGLSVEKIE